MTTVKKQKGITLDKAYRVMSDGSLGPRVENDREYMIAVRNALSVSAKRAMNLRRISVLVAILKPDLDPIVMDCPAGKCIDNDHCFNIRRCIRVYVSED